tara:strand:+ start:232 stop:450 length:219 start_codon:yes stop_codon:yes gene_type:complete
MKTINIAAIVIIGLVFVSDKDSSVQPPQVCTPIVVEPGIEIKKEVAVVENESTADTFSRPRKPCPPSGPGRR